MARSAALRLVAIVGAMTALFFVSGLLVFLTPVPVCVLVARRQRWAAGSAVVTTIACLTGVYLLLLPHMATGGVLTGLAKFLPLPGLMVSLALGQHVGQAFAVGYLLYYLAIGWLLGEGVARERREIGLVVGVALASVCCVAGTVVVLRWGMQIPIVEHIRTYLRYLLDQFLRMNAEAGIAAEQLAVLQTQADAVTTTALHLLPAFVWTASLYAAVVNLAVSRWVLRAYGIGQYLRGLRQWRAPFEFVWVVIATGIAFFLNQYIVQSAAVVSVCMNILISCAAVYLLQGAGVAQAILQRASVWGRWTSYLISFMFLQTIMPLLAILGLIDAWVNFRRYLERPKNNGISPQSREVP